MHATATPTAARLLFDCSFTRVQTGEVGITRVVRRLAAELRRCPPCGMHFQPVAYSAGGWRLLDAANEPRAARRERADLDPGPLARLLRASGDIRLRRLIREFLPVSLQEFAWWTFSRMTYGRICGSLPLVEIRPDDVLVLCDASWNYRVWKLARDAKKSGARVCTMIHDLIPLDHPEFCAPLLTRIFDSWLRQAIATSDALICNSRATAETVADFRAKHGLASLPVGWFRLGVDLPEPGKCRQPGPAISELVSAATPFFLMVGSIEPRKNHRVALDACEELWRSGDRIRLVIAGRAADGADATVARIRCHPRLGDRLFLVEDATDADLDALYRSARALIFASRAEGFGLPLVEARQRGCWVVASRIPAFEELADEGVRFFDPDSADDLMKLLEALGAVPPSLTFQMPPFQWRDSARAFVAELERIL